ncbi:MAG: TrkH family potassium uptake protein [Clostridia bacterium]|nr:TrkH family potassium uptake protein [Clostridia bacterium]
MNKSMVFKITGIILQIEALLLLLPAVVSLLYRELNIVLAFLITAVLAAVAGTVLRLVFKPKNDLIYSKEGLVIVALGWVAMSLFGCLPFIISRDIPNFFDAFFETVSGFTTTGASILTNVEALSRGTIFWRSFTHWIGGMGVLVFVTAIIPNMSDRSIHIIKAEMPGPIVGKLVPRVKDTSRVLYLIYIAMTVVQIILLLCGGLDLFESSVLSFGTAGTGGFAMKNDSIASYSPYIQWVITVFMLIFGVNFNLYYLCLIRRFRSAVKSEELWVYLSVFAISTGIITVSVLDSFGNFSEALRHSAFQVSSIITTTGYSTTDFNLWPVLCKTLLLIIMMIGSCAGSTAGGFKISRFVIIGKTIKKECQRLIHPRSVRTIKFEGKALDTVTRHGVTAYLAVYAAVLLTVFFLISVDNMSIETNFSATVACFNNIGPGLDGVGPMSNYADYSEFSKTILSFAMLMGRLEIYPMLLAFSVGTWRKR